MMGKAEAALEAFTSDEVNGWAGRDLDLQIGPRRLAFTSETLILSSSLPNFHFHAVTAYDILRHGACRLVSAITRASVAPDRLAGEVPHPPSAPIRNVCSRLAPPPS